MKKQYYKITNESYVDYWGQPVFINNKYDNFHFGVEDAMGTEWFVSGYDLKEIEIGSVSNTDSGEETGITVGLIDVIITQCRVLKGRDLKNNEVKEALKDLFGDEDFNLLLNEYVQILREGQLNS